MKQTVQTYQNVHCEGENHPRPGTSESWFKTLLFLAFFGLASALALKASAQTPGFYKTGTGTSGNTIPLNQASQKTQLLFAPGDFNTLPISGLITKVYFRNSVAGAQGTYTNLKISFLQNLDASIPSTSFYTGLQLVHTAASQTVVANATAGGWFEIPLQTPYFQYDNTKTLIIEIQYSAISGGISTFTSSSTGNKRVSGTSLTNTTGTLNNIWNDFGMDVIPNTPCTAPPTAGTAITSLTSVCPGTNFTLNLTGASVGSGLTYQWEVSANGTSGWTPVGSASGTSFLTTSQVSGTWFYRAAVTCSGQTDYSTPVSVTAPALVSGNFTIDNNSPASATNFQNFTSAINYLSCGIAGPVTFTVASNSGPYNEQIEIPAISGMNATNTITIQGNGRTISADPTTSNRAIIKLNGAKYLTINNLNIATTGTTTSSFGWGIHFTNGADNNTISNNTINIGSLSVSESNSVGIVFVNSTSSVTITGGNNGNNNIISGNTIIGGYAGIHLNNAATNPGNNQLTGNIIRDFYSKGIEVNGATGTLIESNNISRPNVTDVGSFYGIYLGGTAQNTIVSKNRLHNTHGGATTLTGSSFGIYSNANDAPTGSENIVKNNLIYNINNTGTINALYNSSSDGVYYYHNTIALDNIANTGFARGFYQTTTATNLKLINNNIVITTGGIAANLQAIYLNTATTALVSNNNNLYVPTGNTGYYSGSDWATLANWQSANSTTPFDLNSVAADPFFTNPAAGNFNPTNGALNNAGQPTPAVTTDITGATRNPTSPDIGAYEFSPSALDLGITSLVTPIAKNCFSNAEPVTVTVKNFGSSTVDFSVITVTATVTVSGAATPAPFVITLTNAMNGGQPLAAGAEMNVVVGTLNMTTTGTYTFNANSAVTAGGTDGNTANNAMPAMSLVVSPLAAGTASATFSSICLSGTTTLNLNGSTGGDIQWQQSASATGPFTNIAGANTATFTPAAALTQTTYYQAVVSCGSNNATSNVVTVNVITPTAPTATGASRCGSGTITLNATAASGATINWYTAATGGSSVATGTSYSPTVTATTTYYVTGSNGGGSYQVGPASNAIGATSGSATTTYYQIFDVLTPLTIQSVYVYPTVAGNVNLHISDNAGTVLHSISVPVTSANVNNKTLIPINFALPVGTGYRMGWATGGVSLLRNSAGATYPYTVPGVISVTGNSFTSGANYWYAVYDWSISTGCESNRIPVVATVNPLPATPTITRNGASGQTLSSSSATGNQWYLNGTAIPGATNQTYNTTANGSYTVDVTSNGCTSLPSAPVTIANTGISKTLAGMSVSVYPNPNNGIFNVKLTGYKQNASLELYSLTGQLIVKTSAKAGQEITPIQVNNLAAGTYLLKVVSDKGVQIHKMIVE